MVGVCSKEAQSKNSNLQQLHKGEDGPTRGFELYEPSLYPLSPVHWEASSHHGCEMGEPPRGA